MPVKYVEFGPPGTSQEDQANKAQSHWTVMKSAMSDLELAVRLITKREQEGGNKMSKWELGKYGRRLEAVYDMWSHLKAMRAQWLTFQFKAEDFPKLYLEKQYVESMDNVQEVIKQGLQRLADKKAKRTADQSKKMARIIAEGILNSPIMSEAEGDDEDGKKVIENVPLSDEESEKEPEGNVSSDDDTDHNQMTYNSIVSEEEEEKSDSDSSSDTSSDEEEQKDVKSKGQKGKTPQPKVKAPGKLMKSISKTAGKVEKRAKSTKPAPKFKRHMTEMLPKFYGKILDFPRFFRIFEYVIHNTDLPDDLKMQSLLDHIKDPELYKRLSKYDTADYQQALDDLKEEFSGICTTMDGVMEIINGLPTVRQSSNVDDLDKLVGAMRGIISLMKTKKMDKAYELQVCKTIGPKMPSWIIKKYTGSLGKELPDLQELLNRTIAAADAERKSKLHFGASTSSRENTGEKSERSITKPEPKPKPKTTERQANYFQPRPRTNYGRVNEVHAAQQVSQDTTRNEKGFTTKPTGENRNDSRAKVQSTRKCTRCGLQNHIYPQCNLVPMEDRLNYLQEHRLCFLCFKPGHMKRDCTAEYQCRKCKGRHNTALCLTRKQQPPKEAQDSVNEVHTVSEPTPPPESDDSSDEDTYNRCLKTLFAGNVKQEWEEEHADEDSEFITVLFNVQSNKFAGMLDTGASVNLFPKNYAKKMNFDTYPINKKLGTPQGEFYIESATKVPVRIGSIEVEVEFMLYGKSMIILGLPCKKNFKLNTFYDGSVTQGGLYGEPSLQLRSPKEDYVLNIESDLSSQQFDSGLEKILDKHPNSFVENNPKIGTITTEKCNIKLTDNMPIYLRAYKCSPADQELVEQHIKELLAQGLIKPSTSPYSFPIVLVDKKDDGKKSRFCVNYIKLNDVTILECFPMPKIDDIKDSFLDATIFSTIDLASGFHHIVVNEEDQAKTAFSTMNGHYEWTRMPFGLKNAPIIFQRVISNLLQKYGLNKFAIGYIDDIIIFSKSRKEHLEHLAQLMEMVEKEDIRLKKKKCQFGKKSVTYLGYQIEKNTVSPLHSNTMAIQKVTPPEDVKALRSFLGQVNFYHKFVPNRASLLYPLYQLLKKKTEWNWDEECQEVFCKVKEILTSHPVLRIFDPENPTFLYTDASRKGIGAALKQVDRRDPGGGMYVVGYFSCPLCDYQQNYGVTELELLAIVRAIDYFHYYLVSVSFTVVTDHLPLKAIKKFDKPNTRLFNWSMRLSQYRFTVEYLPGPKNHEADYLSRHPVDLLQEVTGIQVLWVNEERIRNAQRGIEEASLPNRVRRIERNGEEQIIYVKGDQEKIYLPNELAAEVLLELHLAKVHMGAKQLALHFCRKYYTPNLDTLAREVTLNCHICLMVKNTGFRFGTLGVVGPALEPFDILHFDTKSGFNGLGSIKKEAHLIIDASTRFLWVLVSKTKKAEDFINLINLPLSIQKPKLIVADNYPSNKSKVLRKFLTNRKIPIVFTSVNDPKSNGLIERANQTIMSMMKCLRQERPNASWVTLIRVCVEKYNETIHTSTGYPPIYLLTGRDDEGLFKDESLEESREKALENSQSTHEKSAQQYDKGRKDPELKPGDVVYVKTKHALNRKKLEPQYEGPCEVKAKLGHTTYEVDNRGKIEKRHVSQMKTNRLPEYISRNPVLFLLGLFLMLFISPINCNVPDERVSVAGPLLWHQTKHVPVVGYNYSTHVAVLANPCMAFLDLHRRTNNSQAMIDFISCSDLFTGRILKLISKHCNHVDKVQALTVQNQHIGKRHRKKRFLPFVPLAWFALGGVVSWGVLSVKHLFEGDTSKDVSLINKQLEDKMTNIRLTNEKNFEFQREVAGILKNESMRLSDLRKDLDIETESARLYTILVETIGRIELHLQYLLQGFAQGKVKEDYNILFPDSPLSKGGTPLHYWKAHQCSYSGQNNDILIMRFEIPRISKTVKILQADPFRVYTNNSEGIECQRKYKGDPFVLYDSVSKCTRDLLSSPLTHTEVVLIDESHHDCIDNVNRSSAWETVHCGNTEKRKKISQVKQDHQNFYLYCFPNHLRLNQGNEFQCENLIYKFPRSIEFYINNYKWEVINNVVESAMDVHSDVSALINRRIFHKQLGVDKAIGNLNRLIKEEEKTNALVKWEDVSSSPVTWFSITTFFLTVIAAIVLIYCCRRYIQRKRIRGLQTEKQTRMKLSELLAKEEQQQGYSHSSKRH